MTAFALRNHHDTGSTAWNLIESRKSWMTTHVWIPSPVNSTSFLIALIKMTNSWMYARSVSGEPGCQATVQIKRQQHLRDWSCKATFFVKKTKQSGAYWQLEWLPVSRTSNSNLLQRVGITSQWHNVSGKRGRKNFYSRIRNTVYVKTRMQHRVWRDLFYLGERWLSLCR